MRQTARTPKKQLLKLALFWLGLLLLTVVLILSLKPRQPRTAQGESNQATEEAPLAQPKVTITELPTQTPTFPPSPSPVQATPTTAILGVWRAENIEVTSEKAIEVPEAYELLSQQGTRLVFPRVSQEGTRVLFERYTGERIACYEGSETCSYPAAELWLYSLADETWVKLDGPAVQGSWSPDGTDVAYLAQVGPGQYDLRWIMASGGTPLTVVQNVKRARPAWRSSEQIVYLNRDGSISEIQLADLRQNIISPIKVQKSGGPESFALSSDGQRIAVVKEGDVWLVHLDQEKEPQILTRPAEYLSFSNIIGGMAWSRDGRYLALAAGTGYITIYDREGRFISAIAMGPEAIYSLSWSPDGSSVAALSQRRSSKGPLYDIVIANTDGSIVKGLGIDEESQKYTLSWLPTAHLIWTTDFQQVPYMLELTHR